MNIVKKTTAFFMCLIFGIVLFVKPVQASDNILSKVNSINPSAGAISSLTFSPDSSLICFGAADKNVYIYDVQTGTQKYKFAQSSISNKLLFNSDGSLLFSAASDGKVYIWDMKTSSLSKTLAEHSASVNSLALSQDMSTLISVSDDKTLKMWDINKGTSIKTLSFNNILTSTCYLPNDTKIAVAKNNGDVEILNGSSGDTIKIISNIFGDNSSIDDICPTNDGNYIICSNYSKSQPVELKINDNFSNRSLDKDSLNGEWGKISLTKDGNYIASSNNGHSYIYDFNTGKIVNFDYASGKIVAFSNNSKFFAALDKDSSNNYIINIYDSSKLQLKYITSLSIEPNSIVLGFDDEISIKVIAHYSDNSEEDVTSKVASSDWVTPNIDIAYINANKGTIISREKEGTTVIIAKYKDFATAITVNVEKNLQAYDGNGTYVEVGAKGIIKTSTDKVNWTTVNSQTSNNLNSVVWNGFEFATIGDLGTVLTSTNGAIWVSRDSNTKNDLSDIKWNTNSNCFAISGKKGTVLRSADGINWGTISTNITDDLDRINIDGKKFSISGENALFTLSNDDIKVLSPKLQESSTRKNWTIKFTKSASDKNVKNIKLYNYLGKELEKTITVDSGNLVLTPTNNLESGIYVIEVNDIISSSGDTLERPVYMVFKAN